MNRDEESHSREGGDKNNGEKEAAKKPAKSNNPRKPQKYESSQKSKNSRPNSGQNRRESSRSRSRSRSQLRQTSIPRAKKSWKSANAWLNFMQDFREDLRRGYPALQNANVFRLAGKQWSEMTSEQKKPYIDAANKMKRQKELENGHKPGNQSKTPRKTTKFEKATKILNKKKNKPAKVIDEKSDSESGSETEVSTKTVESDNASMDSDGSI